MKNILFSIILLFIAIVFAKAQPISTFAPVGSEWWYQATQSSPIDFRLILRYFSVEEILYESQLCKRIEVRDKDSVKLSDEYVYNNDDTVFYYSNRYKRFVPLYIFNVKPGDTLTFYVPEQGQDLTTDTTFRVLVDTVYKDVVHGDLLQRIFLKQIYESYQDSPTPIHWGFGWINQRWPSAGNYIEKLGCTKGAFISHNAVYASSTGHINPEILCYKDSSFSVVYNYNAEPVNEDCLYPGKLSIDNLSHLGKSLAVYPNPAREYVQFKVPDGIAPPNEIKVFDFTGKTVQTIISSGNNQFSVQNLPQGIYTVAVPIEGNWYYVKMMKL